MNRLWDKVRAGAPAPNGLTDNQRARFQTEIQHLAATEKRRRGALTALIVLLVIKTLWHRRNAKT